MSDFSQRLISRSGYEREGFADLYEDHRPSPPAALLEVLAFVAGTKRPGLVVNLGCGTGLSTRAWSQRALRLLETFDRKPALAVEGGRIRPEEVSMRPPSVFVRDLAPWRGSG